MNQRNIVLMGTPSLLQPSSPIECFDRALIELINELKFMKEQKGGVGIAAPQIGENKRIIFFGFEKNIRYPNEEPIPFTTLVNPEYEVLSNTLIPGWEGCLSVPNLRGLVDRYQKIRYWGYDEKGVRIERIAENFHARVIQHEVDHLDGILFPFKVKNLANFGFETALIERGYSIHG